MTSTQNIAKNSLILYFRMFLNMGVGLFTAGIVLNTLGISDYGVYNVVGGFVSLFGFLNSSMSSATQRFLSYDLGKNNQSQLRKTFSTTVTIHFVIALVIVTALETFGLWYINNRLNVPAERIPAINIVYQFSVLSFFFGIIQVPYNALINAHERFNVYAYISFLEIIFKLIMLFLITRINYDKLILYSGLLFCSSFIIRMIYRIYCRKNFVESRYKFYYDKKYFKTLLSYSGWSLFTNIAFVAKNQGVNLLLNFFFGTGINAAYGITNQVQGIILNFVASFQNAVNPQIVKSYAAGNVKRSIRLMQQSAKFSFGLMLIITVPILISINDLLTIWLKNYPIESILFIRLTIINVLLDTISNPIVNLIQAKGKIKKYQIIVGILLFLNLPISYILLEWQKLPQLVYMVSVFISLLALVVRVIFVKNFSEFKNESIISPILGRILIISIFSAALYYCLETTNLFKDRMVIGLLIKSAISVLILCLLSFFILFEINERTAIKNIMLSKLKNLKKKYTRNEN